MTNKEISITRRVLKKKVLEHNDTMQSHVKQSKQIYDLLSRTVEYGESNSALVIGPHRSGKTTLINSVIEDLKKLKSFKANSILVKLNGLLHTDDKLALASITSQMLLDNVIGDKVFGSFAENLAFLLACLRTGNKETSKSVIFVIDEFDLFCAHQNQTLLYNLFDISQLAQAPICVIGVTCRFDVIELLEKRVKSRFSHRQIFIFHGIENTDYAEFMLANVKNMLILSGNKELSNKYVSNWNSSISKLCNEKKMRNLIQRIVNIDLNERNVKNILILLLSKLSDIHKEITVTDFEEEMKNFEKDSITEQILDLSVLELSLLISIKHHVEIYDNQPMNFEMIYARYVKFMNSCNNMQTIQRPVIMKAYEHLRNIEFLEPLSGGSTGRIQKEYEMVKPLVTNDQILEAVKRWPGLPTEMAQWATSSLI